MQYILDRVAAQPPRPLSGAKSQRSGLATPLCRSLFFSGSPARSASGPGTQWAPRVGPFGPLGPLRGPKGPLGLGGYSEAISNGWPLRMEGNFDWNAISNGRSFGYMGLLPNSAPARLNQPFRFKNIPSKSAVFTPMLSRPAEAPTKTGAEIHPKPSSTRRNRIARV